MKVGRIRDATRGETGSAILEFAFVLPLLLLVTLGVAEFGRAWLVVNTLNHATREAVRAASTTMALKVNDPAVVNTAQAILNVAGVKGASVTNSTPAGTPPAVTVTASYNFAFLTGVGPLYKFSFAGTLPLTSTATMRYER